MIHYFNGAVLLDPELTQDDVVHAAEGVCPGVCLPVSATQQDKRGWGHKVILHPSGSIQLHTTNTKTSVAADSMADGTRATDKSIEYIAHAVPLAKTFTAFVLPDSKMPF